MSATCAVFVTGGHAARSLCQLGWPVDAKLQALGRRKRWIVQRKDLLDAGFKPTAIKRRLKAEVLHKLFRGVYLVGRTTPTRLDLERGALLAGGPRSTIAFDAAAAIHGLPHKTSSTLELWVPTHRRNQRGLIAHQGVLHRRDTCVRGGRRVTSVARTLSDMAIRLDAAGIERLVHEAEYLGLLRPDEVRAAVARGGPRKHQHLLLDAVERRTPRVGRGGTRLAVRVHRVLIEAGLGGFEVERGFELEDGEKVSLDIYWPEFRYGIEVDGAVHRTVRNFEEDRRRDRRMAALHDVLIGRVTQKDLDERVEEWIRDVRTTTAARKVR